MNVAGGKLWIERLRKRWIIFSVGKIILLSLSVALVMSALAIHFSSFGLPVFILSFLLVLAVLAIKSRFWHIGPKEITSFIDFTIKEAEDSSGLLLKPLSALSFLEQLQAEKINAVLIAQKQPSAPVQQLKIPLFVLILAALISYAFIRIPFTSHAVDEPVTLQKNNPVIKEVIPPSVSSFTVKIKPPAYTGAAARSQQQFTLMAESGAQVSWTLKTSQSLHGLSFVFNDNQRVHLKRANAEGTSWTLSKTLFQPGFYQLIIDGKRSDFYQIGIIADQPVSIKIRKPAQHSTIDIGRPKRVNLSVRMQDDYGIADAYISATMASGKGEAVSFKEKKLPFNLSLKGKKQVNIEKVIALGELGMKPGDELYFYISATDNHGQTSRSDMYFVSIQDTTELMSLAGIDNGVNLVPEYFRSERQIIIDTEKLIKEKSGLSDAEFKRRSNDLGIDQKMLRLRYGKFLGEESSVNIGGEYEGEGHEEEGHEHHDETAAAGDVSGIMEQYAHKHDNAEDATFFEPQLKAQLKATLTEMWNAELRLRTYRPEEALPYEYKALRLLKDLQQKSRAYVAKSTFKTSPLKPEKRLTGELTEITAGLNKSMAENKEQKSALLKQAIGILESKKTSKILVSQDVTVLLKAQEQLIAHASVSPAIYLTALQSLKKIISGQNSAGLIDIARAEKGISHLLGQQTSSPSPQTNTSSSKLSRSYFDHLKKLMP
jgi:hypothetical protein